MINIPVELQERIEKASRQREAVFLELMESHKNIIQYCIRKYRDFSRVGDHKDYLQEIYFLSWKDFHQYQALENLPFSTFLFNRCRWAILGYRREHEWHNKNVVLWEFLPENLSMDQHYEEEHIKSLKKAIADLSEEEQFVVNLYLEGEDLTMTALTMGKYGSYYRNKMVDIRNKIRERKSRYFEDLIVDYKRKHRAPGQSVNFEHQAFSVGYFPKIPAQSHRQQVA